MPGYKLYNACIETKRIKLFNIFLVALVYLHSVVLSNILQSPMSNNASAMAAGTGNGNFRIVQQQPHSLPTRVLHQVALNGGSNSIYDAYYNLVELNKLSQADQTMTQTTDGLQGYYNGLASGLQSPGSAGIPEIILTGKPV